jgi:1,4-dihydroxy-2-naphthoate octaprenyltransferase
LFLLPVFLFAFSVSNHPEPIKVFSVFFILHFLLYPASNGYNSYFDKDEKSIGGLKHPPKVKRELYYTSIAMDVVAVLLGLWISIPFAAMLLIYGLISKAYSHPAVRIKKYPWASWLVAGIFQGFFTFLMCYQGMNDAAMSEIFTYEVLVPAALSTALLLGSYPMTQIYQHEEDSSRGDITLSIKLGINGTFYLTAIIFGVAVVLFLLYFRTYFEEPVGAYFLAFTMPMAVYFAWWFLKSLRDPGCVDYIHTMRLNAISSICLSGFFLLLAFL